MKVWVFAAAAVAAAAVAVGGGAAVVVEQQRVSQALQRLQQLHPRPHPRASHRHRRHRLKDLPPISHMQRVSGNTSREI